MTKERKPTRMHALTKELFNTPLGQALLAEYIDEFVMFTNHEHNGIMEGQRDLVLFMKDCADGNYDEAINQADEEDITNVSSKL